jgi:hypothetical protein
MQPDMRMQICKHNHHIRETGTSHPPIHALLAINTAGYSNDAHTIVRFPPVETVKLQYIVAGANNETRNLHQRRLQKRRSLQAK